MNHHTAQLIDTLPRTYCVFVNASSVVRMHSCTLLQHDVCVPSMSIDRLSMCTRCSSSASTICSVCGSSAMVSRAWLQCTIVTMMTDTHPDAAPSSVWHRSVMHISDDVPVACAPSSSDSHGR